MMIKMIIIGCRRVVVQLKVNELDVSVDRHKKLSISLHTSADICN
jgi:hypothetical protein